MICEHCQEDKPDTVKRRQNTAYVDDELNWVTICDACADINSEYWAQMWIDYWSMVL